jgi:hypothetical protein
MTAIIKTTGDDRWDAVAAAVGAQTGDILNTEIRDGETHYNINFPKLPDGTGYGGLFLGVPASVVTIS